MANTKERDEGRVPMDVATKGQAEEPTDIPSTNEDEERSARERRLYAEKKAASPGSSGL